MRASDPDKSSGLPKRQNLADIGGTSAADAAPAQAEAPRLRSAHRLPPPPAPGSVNISTEPAPVPPASHFDEKTEDAEPAPLTPPSPVQSSAQSLPNPAGQGDPVKLSTRAREKSKEQDEPDVKFSIFHSSAPHIRVSGQVSDGQLAQAVMNAVAQAHGTALATLRQASAIEPPKPVPIELQILPGHNLCLRDAIALNLVTSRDAADLQSKLVERINSGILPRLTILAMVLSALHANGLRGYKYPPEVLENLFDFIVQGMPEDMRLEALLVFRCMHGAEADNPSAQACEQRFRKRYGDLAPATKGLRLHAWAKMEWWNDAIANFHGHTEPVKSRALQGMLAMLGPRLSSQSERVKQTSLAALWGAMPTHQEPAAFLSHWGACVDAWCEVAARSKPEDISGLMKHLLMPLLYEGDPSWPNKARLLLAALQRCISTPDKSASTTILDAMKNWFLMLGPKAMGLHRSDPGQAVALAVAIAALIRPLKQPWSETLDENLRMVMNAAPGTFNAANQDARNPTDCATS